MELQFKRGRRVYAKVISDASGDTRAPLAERKAALDSIVYTDSWKGYNALAVSSLRRLRLNHSELFADKPETQLHQSKKWVKPHL